jgi:hypothetical protein
MRCVCPVGKKAKDCRCPRLGKLAAKCSECGIRGHNSRMKTTCPKGGVMAVPSGETVASGSGKGKEGKRKRGEEEEPPQKRQKPEAAKATPQTDGGRRPSRAQPPRGVKVAVKRGRDEEEAEDGPRKKQKAGKEQAPAPEEMPARPPKPPRRGPNKRGRSRRRGGRK